MMEQAQDPGRTVSLEPFGPRHLPLLERWLHAPHVTPWWGDPAEPLSTAARLPAGGHHRVIAIGGEPVGYLRWAKKSKETLIAVGLGDLPDGTYDIDLLIGEAQRLGQGIGTRALQLLVARFRRDPPMPCLGLVTSVDNLRAIRSYEKVGFVRDRRFEDSTFGDCWVMLYAGGKA